MLSALKVRHLRCFEAFAAEFAPGMKFIVGPNARGGGAGFRERMLRLLDAAGERLPGSRLEAAAQRDHGIDGARRLLEMGLRCLGLQREELAGLKKEDARKAAIAALIRRRTTVPTAWIARELALGHASRVSHCLKNAPSELLRTLENGL